MKTSEITGKEPNEKWTNLGFFVVAAGVLSLLGINITGVEIGDTKNQYTPWLVILFGAFSMWYGTTLKKNQVIANRIHELEMERIKHTINE